MGYGAPRDRRRGATEETRVKVKAAEWRPGNGRDLQRVQVQRQLTDRQRSPGGKQPRAGEGKTGEPGRCHRVSRQQERRLVVEH